MNKKGFLFSFFLFAFSFLLISNVKAVSIKGINVDQDFLESLFDRYFEGKTVYEAYGKGSTTRVFHKEDFPYIVCIGLTSTNPSGPSVECNFLYDYTISSVDTNKINITSTTKNKYYYTPTVRFVSPSNYFNFKYTNPSPIYLNAGVYSNTATISYTNFDVYQNDTLLVSKSINYDSSGKKNISFHLNGGTAFDTSNVLSPVLHETDFIKQLKATELNDYLESLTPMKNRATFLGWYYDSEFTQAYDSSES